MVVPLRSEPPFNKVNANKKLAEYGLRLIQFRNVSNHDNLGTADVGVDEPDTGGISLDVPDTMGVSLGEVSVCDPRGLMGSCLLG